MCAIQDNKAMIRILRQASLETSSRTSCGNLAEIDELLK